MKVFVEDGAPAQHRAGADGLCALRFGLRNEFESPDCGREPSVGGPALNRQATLSVTQFMRCFYHEDREAVGTCKSCGKGLCRECAVDLTKGLACRRHCEADAQALIQLIDRNIQLSSASARLVQQSRGVRSGSGIFFIGMGVLFLIWGLSDERLRLITVMGVGFIAYGIYWLFLARKLGKDKKTPVA